MHRSALRAVAVVMLGLCTAAFAAPAARTTPPKVTIAVDATEAARKIFHAKLTIPAAPGPLTLYYPKWIPGEHGPTGPINDLSGLTLRAGGTSIPWRRDDVDLYAFHCTVPDGADAVDVTLDFLGTSSKEGFASAASLTARLAILNWNLVVLYPQGRAARDVPVRASITVPPGWKLGTALPVEQESAA